jgi:8-hydroxy-5-deazaflavin:NADPH oxidoreductase
MKIAIIGAGEVGLTLGRKWAAQKHEIVFGSRPTSLTKHREQLTSLGINARVDAIEAAARDADVIVLAVPHEQILEVADLLRDLKNKTIIDVSNWALPGWSGLKLGFNTSGAEEVQKHVPQSHVVKAFNHYGADVIANPQFGDSRAVLYFCGSNAEALNKASQLVADAGFEGVAVNDLKFARALEPLAQIWVAGIKRFGTEHALALVKR